MLNIKVSLHIALTCLAALLYASIASAECCTQQTAGEFCTQQQTTVDCCTQQTTMMDTTLPPCRPAASAPCYVVGSNGEICASEPANRFPVDEWRPEYQCYADYGICERDDNGQCGWRNTDGLSQCLANMRVPESIQPCTPFKPYN